MNLKKDFRFGLVWGKSVKFGGQRVGLKHVLIDEDVLTIIKIHLPTTLSYFITNLSSSVQDSSWSLEKVKVTARRIFRHPLLS